MSDNNSYNIDDLGYLGDAFSAYLRYIKNFPPLPHDEIYKLGLKSMRGDMEAREKLILHHLAFVVFIAKPFFSRYPNVDAMDIVQYGNEGLIKAVSMYDPHTGALTTYAGDWIKQRIVRNLDVNHSDIKTSVSIQQAKRNYSKIIYEVENKGRIMPSDEELCEILNVSSESLDYIKELYNTSVVSINKEITSDGDELELFIEDELVDKPEDVIDDIDQFEILIAIKNKLTPLYYYVFYMRVIDERDHTLEELAEEVGVTRERIRQIEAKAKEKARIIINSKGSIFRNTINSLKLEYKTKFYKLSEKPLTPKQIINYLYYRKFFSGTAKEIVFDLFCHPQKLTKKEQAEKYSMTLSEYESLLNKIQNKIRIIFEKSKTDYLDFSKQMTETYKSLLYDIDLTNDELKYNSKDIIDRYSSKSFEEIKSLYGNSFNDLEKHTRELLRKFFSKEEYIVASIRYIEKEVNLALFNCKKTNTNISPTLLYPTYLKYINSFSEEQQLLLDCFVFNKKEKKRYYEMPHATPKATLMPSTMQKLEKLYFGLDNIFWGQNLTKEIYEEVLRTSSDEISDERKRILNLYYGVGPVQMGLKEMVEKYNLDYLKTHSFLKSARNYVYNLYLKRCNKNKYDKDIYSKYILDKTYELTDETRNILKMHIIDKLDYEEISSLTGLKKNRISNIIGDGIRKIDFYRYGIITSNKIDEETIQAVLDKSKTDNKELDTVIIKLRYIENLQANYIFELLNGKRDNVDKYLIIKFPILKRVHKITKEYITNTISKFNEIYKTYMASKIELTEEELIELTNKRPLESVISDEENRVLSFALGIKNTKNPSGKTFSKDEIMEIMEVSEDKYFHLRHSALKKLKLNVLGILVPENIYMPLDDLEKALNDRHVPISDKERLIINHICNLNGYEHLDFKELVNVLNETDNSLRRRYQRAIVTIKKYYAGEIEGQIDYETDLLPNLKYFNKTERIYINEYFVNNLSFSQIAKKYSLSIDQVSSYFDSIYSKIHEILNEPKEKRFDYDYAEKVLDMPDLPFFGNQKLAKEVYTLVFGGKSMTKIPLTEVEKMIDVDASSRVLNDILVDYMISICKYRMGIKKNITFTHEQVVDYYERHEDSLRKERLLLFSNYFSRYKKESSSNSTYISDSIIYLLLQESMSNCFKVSTSNKKEVLNILRNKKHRINKKVRNSLMQLFDITERELLNGQEINHIIRTLHMLDLSLDKANQLTTTETKKRYLN